MTFSIVSVADFHQGDARFSVHSRGLQCVPNCAFFFLLVHILGVQCISKCDLHNVLYGGDFIYRHIIASCVPGLLYLLPNELPECFEYDNNFFSFTVKEIYSGAVHESDRNEYPYMSLENAFTEACTTTGPFQFILIVDGNAIAIYVDASKFYIFDPHSRNSNGLPCPEGASVLGVVQTMQLTCSFIRTLYQKSPGNLNTKQFDLHKVELKQRGLKWSNRKTVCSVPGPQFQNSDSHLPHENFISILVRDCELPDNSSTHYRTRERLLSRKRLSDSDHNIGTNKQLCVSVNSGNMSLGQRTVSVLIPSFLNQTLSSECLNDKEVDRIVNIFNKHTSDGPRYVCACCTQLFFKHSVVNIERCMFTNQDVAKKCVLDIKSAGNKTWLCHTCSVAIRNGKVPACFIHNGLQFPQKPAELNLTQLEERLVAARLPFMQIREMPRGGQLSIKGNVVNVPADVNRTVKQLPRLLDDNETIPVKFKRSLSLKHHITFENIRPNKVFEAAKWLVKNSTIFRNEGIQVDESWLHNAQVALSVDESTGGNENIKKSKAVESDTDQWTEDDELNEQVTGNLDTVLQPVDYREFNQILSLAPGEGNSPLGLFQDALSEFLAFPTIYCGQTRIDNSKRIIPLHYSTICKWELRNVDRRVAECLPNIFFKLKKLQIKQIKDKVGVAVRKCKTEGKKITVGEILSPGGIDKLTKQDDGYRVLRNLRGSPPYWEKCKKDLFAMIKQLGIPAWFCTFSAAETKWHSLLRCLWRLQKKEEPTDDDINAMTWIDTCKLIKSDPVTCARYFDHRFQAFIHDVLKDKSHPIGEIADFFYRVEFQQRGSPHIHMLIWIKNAPQFTEGQKNEEVASFIDQHATCEKNKTIPELVNYQTHRHARTCRKRGRAVCRFNFPLPSMPETCILLPLNEEEQCIDLVKGYKKIMNEINSMKPNADVTFQEFLKQLDMSYHFYLQCIRSSLKSPTVFLRRAPGESRINSYNTTLLRCWQANMDIQYVLDPYACVSYIASYLTKGQRGLSNLLYQACQEAKSAESDIRQQVRRVGNQFLNHVEVGAQEACYLVLQMPLRRSTRNIVFVDTSTPETRTALLRTTSDLKLLPKNSTNIESDSPLKRYKRRPCSMYKFCYADFISWFDVLKSKSSRKPSTIVESEPELPEDDYDVDVEDEIVDELDIDSNPAGVDEEQTYEFRDGLIMRKRKKQKVLRYSRISKNANEEQHYRGLIMLFTVWRNEERDLLGGFCTFKDCYVSKKDEILYNQSKYEAISVELDDILIENDDDIGPVWDSVAPEAQHQENIDMVEGQRPSGKYCCFNADENAYDNRQNSYTYDLGQDIGVTRRQLDADYKILNEVSNDEFLEMVLALNRKQKQFFYHVLHWVKTKDVPIYNFLSGGAGVGKSVLLRTLHQALLKYYNKNLGENLDNEKTLLCAPTGKAAHNIGGRTIHAAFGIPVGKGFQYKPLDMQQLNTLRSRYQHLKMVFIDEVSMVGRNMFNFINLRLQEIAGTNTLFGGVSIIAFGDLFQLKPVMDSWIFCQSTAGCSLHNIASNIWADNFCLFELDEIMRQKDDLAFAQLLNRLREGNHVIDDIENLETRCICQDKCQRSETVSKMPHLYTTRAEVGSHNFCVLEQLPPSHKTEILAMDVVSGDFSFDLQKKIISKIPDDTSQTMGLASCLTLGIDLPAELCLNINVEDGMTNGAACHVKKFDFRVAGSERCSIVWVVFEENAIGRHWREKYKHLYIPGINKQWTPILETTRQFTLQYFKTYSIVRRQFPLMIAAGKTIHKAQGSTLQDVVIDFGNRKNDHMHYVGLSRVRNMNSLHIQNLNPNKISVSNAVKAEMDRLRSNGCVQICLPNIQSINNKYLKISFHNCRSLHKHKAAVHSELQLHSFDIAAYSETHHNSSDVNSYQLEGYSVFLSENESGLHNTVVRPNPFHGLAVYWKHHTANLVMSTTVQGIEVSVMEIGSSLNICFVYCPPKQASLKALKHMLVKLASVVSEVKPTIIIGDFNQDFLQSSSFASYMQNEHMPHYKQLINTPTTDYGSCLDHIYVNFDSLHLVCYGTLESYFSDHKPIYIILDPATLQ